MESARCEEGLLQLVTLQLVVNTTDYVNGVHHCSNHTALRMHR